MSGGSGGPAGLLCCWVVVTVCAVLAGRTWAAAPLTAHLAAPGAVRAIGQQASALGIRVPGTASSQQAPPVPAFHALQSRAAAEPNHADANLFRGLAQLTAGVTGVVIGLWMALRPSAAPAHLTEDVPLTDLGQSRRRALSSLAAAAVSVPAAVAFARAPAGEIQVYPDFTRTASGLQYKDVVEGPGKVAQRGDRVVYKWEGYTVGYYGRPFQKSNGPIGGAFTEEDSSYSRFVVGEGEVISGLEEAVQGMHEGGLRQIIIPPGPLSYPEDDPNHTRVGPAPSTFSGFRALNFVLFNQGGTMDKTLLINVKVLRVDKPGERGFQS